MDRPNIYMVVLGPRSQCLTYVIVCVCVCVCVCIYVCVCVCVCVRARARARAYIYIYMCVCMYVCMYVCIYIYMFGCKVSFRECGSTLRPVFHAYRIVLVFSVWMLPSSNPVWRIIVCNCTSHILVSMPGGLIQTCRMGAS